MAGVPEGWFDYSNFNQCIDKTRILPVKTPLKESFNTGLTAEELAKREIGGIPLGQEFSPTDLMRELAKKGMVLGLVLDLTNTARYYDETDFVSANVHYEKLRCVGREIPSDEIYERFSKTLNSFLSESNNTKIAVIHCTHGLNRTGYLVSRYLVEYLKYKPEDAIKAFETARGYKIERENYLEHLKKGCPRLPKPIDSYLTYERIGPSSCRRFAPYEIDRDHRAGHNKWSYEGRQQLSSVDDDWRSSRHDDSYHSRYSDSYHNHKPFSNHQDSFSYHRDSVPYHRDSYPYHHDRNLYSNHRASNSYRNQDSLACRNQDSFPYRNQDSFPCHNQDSVPYRNQDSFPCHNQDSVPCHNQDSFPCRNQDSVPYHRRGNHSKSQSRNKDKLKLAKAARQS